MAALRSSVFVAAPIPFNDRVGNTEDSVWSPISCTLVYSDEEAVLVDTPITIKQTAELIAWIGKIAPGRKLTYIYITHGHGDHFFGIPQLLERFPDAKAVATKATVRHMEQQIQDEYFNRAWGAFFPGQIYVPFKLAEELPDSNEFSLQNRWLFQAVEVGHSDTYDSSILWVPDLKLAVCGDVVYGQVHQMLLEANNKEKREEWIRAIEKVEALNPVYVVPGHRQAEEIDGVWHLASTKKYLQGFEKILDTHPEKPADVFTSMIKLYPDRFNPMVLYWGCEGSFRMNEVKKEIS